MSEETEGESYPRLPTSAELDRFINAAGPSLRRISIFLLNCDANVSETLLLDWQQVDLAERRARLVSGANERMAQIEPRVLELLERLPHRTGRVFRRPDGQDYVADTSRGGHLKTAFREACLRANVPSISARTLIRIRKIRQMIARLGWGFDDAA
jgi:integrase